MQSSDDDSNDNDDNDYAPEDLEHDGYRFDADRGAYADRYGNLFLATDRTFELRDHSGGGVVGSITLRAGTQLGAYRLANFGEVALRAVSGEPTEEDA